MRWGVVLVVMGALAVYAWGGVYSVDPDEQAVVLRLGQYHRTVDPGRYLFHFPWLERYEKRPVTQLIDVEFGFRTQSSEAGTEYADQPDERRMITTDENLLDVEFVVRYKIANLRSFLFEIADPTQMIRNAGAATARSVVARYAVDTVLKGGRERIESETLVALRETLDAYQAGVQILSVQLQDVEPPNPVIDAFAEVTSAEQEGERLVVEARAYAEKVVPEARGQAEELVNRASAYREARVLRAKGESERFRAVLTEYQKAPEVTRQRLYIETLEEVLPRMEKVVMEEGQSDKILPYLPVLPRKAGP